MPYRLIELNSGELAAKDVLSRLNRDDLLLIDVRVRPEWATAHLPGAHNIPLSDLGARITSVTGTAHIVFYCLAGVRSAQARDLLMRVNRRPSYTLKGGYSSWIAEGLPVVSELAAERRS